MIYSDTFKNFQKQFFNQKYFVLKLKEPNVDEFIPFSRAALNKNR